MTTQASEPRRRPSRRRFLLAAAAAAAPSGLLAAGPARAQADGPWPSRPITYVVPFTPGGSTDVIGRIVAQKLTEALGQPVVVDNRPGAAGAVGASYVARARPDGYTLFGGTISTHAINASLYPDLPYDPVRDFDPLSLVAFLPNVLMVDPHLGVNSVADLVALLKENPARRSFASSGPGTSTHLAGEMLGDILGVRLTHIAYKGTPPAMLDVCAGRVTFMFDQMTAALPLVQAGKLKLLAVTSAHRMALAPQLPTMVEAGVPGFEMASWQAVYAPHGLPPDIGQRLSTEINRALLLPDVKSKLTDQLGMEVVAGPPEQLTALMQKEIPRWSALVKKSGATVS